MEKLIVPVIKCLKDSNELPKVQFQFSVTTEIALEFGTCD